MSVCSTGGTVVKYTPVKAGDTRDTGLIPGLGRSPGEGNGSPLQFSCLENLIVRGAWQATVNGVTKSQTWLKWLSTHSCFLGRETWVNSERWWGTGNPGVLLSMGSQRVRHNLRTEQQAVFYFLTSAMLFPLTGLPSLPFITWWIPSCFVGEKEGCC